MSIGSGRTGSVTAESFLILCVLTISGLLTHIGRSRLPATAVEGEWIEAPGYEVLDILTEKLPDVELVAEDLGDLRPEVLTLKEHYHLKGMKILMFSIETKGKYAYDSFHDTEI